MPRSSRYLNRLTRILLIFAAVLVLLVVGGIWWLNHWLKSPEMHAKLEKELSLTLKMPVKFDRVHISLLGVLKAEGISVPDRGQNFFEATSFTGKADLSALLHGRVALNEIKVESPKFVIVQRANGDWKRPDLPPDLQAELDAKQGAKKVAKAADPNAKKSPAAPGSKKPADVRVGVIRIANGSVDLIDKTGQPFISALGVVANVNDPGEDKVEGYASIGRLVWHGNFSASNVKGTVKQTPEQLIIEKISAAVGGGTLTGGYSHKADPAGPRFSLKLACQNVDISKSAMDADAPPPNLDGNLSGTLEMRGIGDTRKTFNGNAALTLQDGTCREIEWVNQLSDVLQYEDVDLAAFKIKELKTEIQFAVDKLTYNSLVIEAPPLRMTAKGESKFDGTKLRLESKLLADSKFLVKRPNVSPQFGPDDGSGMRPLPFLLTGSFAKPKQNLIERLTGTSDRTEQNIKLGLDALSNLKDERRKKGAPAAGAPNEAPADRPPTPLKPLEPAPRPQP